MAESRKSLDYHPSITKMMIKLGYPLPNEEGVCVGVFVLSSLLVLAGNFQLIETINKRFEEIYEICNDEDRLNKIVGLNNKITTLQNEAKKEDKEINIKYALTDEEQNELKKLNRIKGILDCIYLTHYPGLNIEVFNKKLLQSDLDKVFKFLIESNIVPALQNTHFKILEILDEKHNEVHHFLTNDEVKRYFSSLREIIFYLRNQNPVEPINISFQVIGIYFLHTISFSYVYDGSAAYWVLTDVNQLPIKVVLDSDENIETIIANYIKNGFGLYVCGIKTKIIINEKDISYAKTFVKQWIHSSEFKQLTTDEKLNRSLKEKHLLLLELKYFSHGPYQKGLSKGIREFGESEKTISYWNFILDIMYLRLDYDKNMPVSIDQNGLKTERFTNYKGDDVRKGIIFSLERSLYNKLIKYRNEASFSLETLCEALMNELKNNLEVVEEDHAQRGGFALFGAKVQIFSSNLAKLISDIINRYPNFQIKQSTTPKTKNT